MQPQEHVNTYIAEQPEWQRRILVKLRQHIHSVDEEIEEAWRQNSPSFDYMGAMLSLHGLKSCVSVWFNKGALLKDTHGLFRLTEKDEERGIRKYKIEEGEAINDKAFVDLVKQAMKLNHAGTKLTEAKPTRKALEVPHDLQTCFENDDEAQEHWDKFDHAHKKEWVEWITDAKQDESRKRRIAQALEMIRLGLGKEDKHRVG